MWLDHYISNRSQIFRIVVLSFQFLKAIILVSSNHKLLLNLFDFVVAKFYTEKLDNRAWTRLHFFIAYLWIWFIAVHGWAPWACSADLSNIYKFSTAAAIFLLWCCYLAPENNNLKLAVSYVDIGNAEEPLVACKGSRLNFSDCMLNQHNLFSGFYFLCAFNLYHIILNNTHLRPTLLKWNHVILCMTIQSSVDGMILNALAIEHFLSRTLRTPKV